MNTKLKRNLAGLLLLAALLCVISAVVLAEENNFAGIWRGELGAPAGPGGAGPGGAPGGGGGGRGGGGGGRGGPGGGGPQKIVLRVKVNKDKATGNFTIGSGNSDDLHEGKISGNKLTFKTGLAPAAIYDNEAVITGDELAVSRMAEGGRGARAQTFTLKRSK